MRCDYSARLDTMSYSLGDKDACIFDLYACSGLGCSKAYADRYRKVNNGLRRGSPYRRPPVDPSLFHRREVRRPSSYGTKDVVAEPTQSSPYQLPAECETSLPSR